LATSVPLSALERSVLYDTALLSRPVQAGIELAREGEPANSIHFLLDGWACRFKHHRDGRRSISTILVPGDVCDLDALQFGRLDYGIRTLTAGTVLSLPRERASALVTRHPGIARAVTWLGLVENSILRQGVFCLGRRCARERLAHLVCELGSRLGQSNEQGEVSFDLPLNQTDIADLLGLTAVHVNRTLQQLRADRLIAFAHRKMTICDVAELRKIADFDPGYLHISDPRAVSVCSADFNPVKVDDRARADPL
jgi:CRP-like cAMP-binding protein